MRDSFFGNVHSRNPRILGLTKQGPYLQRQEFIIRTNHQSLPYLSEQTLHSDMQRKAMTRLMGLQFKIVYRKGKENWLLMPFLG